MQAGIIRADRKNTVKNAKRSISTSPIRLNSTKKLKEGEDRARVIAHETLKRVRKKLGF